MMNLAALARVVATISITMALAQSSIEKAKDQATEILTGTTKWGGALSHDARRLYIFQGFLWTFLNMMLLNLINALVLYGVAETLGDSPVRWIVFAGLAFNDLAAVQWLMNTPVAIHWLNSKIREPASP